VGVELLKDTITKGSYRDLLVWVFLKHNCLGGEANPEYPIPGFLLPFGQNVEEIHTLVISIAFEDSFCLGGVPLNFVASRSLLLIWYSRVLLCLTATPLVELLALAGHGSTDQ